MLRPSGVRERLTSAVGPDGSASKPGSQGCAQMPEKSGGASARGADCPNVGAVATTESATAFKKVLSFITCPAKFVTAMLHGFSAAQNPAPCNTLSRGRCGVASGLEVGMVAAGTGHARFEAFARGGHGLR